MNTAIFDAYKNTVTTQLIRVASDYAFINSTQVIDTPKERDDDC